jgi:hypothetical protein
MVISGFRMELVDMLDLEVFRGPVGFDYLVSRVPPGQSRVRSAG